MRLYEKYRPSRLTDVIGQDKAVCRVRSVIERAGFDGAVAFWIAGASGIGKTSIAKTIASQLCKPINVIEIDGDSCSVEAVRKVERDMCYCPWGGGMRTWIVNEAQAMTGRAVQAWLTSLEKLRARNVVIFTSTEETETLFGDFSGPLLSRCIAIRLTNQGLCEAFARRAQEIAQAEGLDGRAYPDYIKLVKACRNNLRAVLQEIEAGGMAG